MTVLVKPAAIYPKLKLVGSWHSSQPAMSMEVDDFLTD
jgi:hypothetical protein